VKTRGGSRHEAEQSRGNESRRHEGESRGHDRGRGRGHDDLRGLLQREVNVLGTVVRQAEAGASWNYSGRHRPGR
jgi:hypothetical protein